MIELLRRLFRNFQKSQSPSNKTSNSQLGRITYTSKSHDEAESEAGEKLYKISDGVYVNQTTYDLIQSEEKPDVKELKTNPFTRLEVEMSDTLATVWSHTTTDLITLAKTESEKKFDYSILKFSGIDYEISKQGVIDVSENIGEFSHLAIDSQRNYLLLTFQNHLVIWDIGNDSQIATIHIEGNGLFNGGFYPDKPQCWSLSRDQYNAGYDWVIWKYETNEITIHELETDDYGRGATLHPGGVLIGALWNAYECGYYIHTLVSDDSKMRYFRQPSAGRPEYENYSPCFSPDGKQFAFIANPYLGMRQNYSKICIYDLETAELVNEFHTGLSLRERQLQFINNGTAIAFYEQDSKKAYVFEPLNGKRTATLKARNTIRYLDGHLTLGCLALAHDTGVTIYHNKTSNDFNHEFLHTATEVANRFITTNEQHLTKPDYWDENEEL